jgi:hypothetical protein
VLGFEVPFFALRASQGKQGSGFRVQRFWVQRFRGSGFSAAAGLKSGQSNQNRNSEKANIEYRIMNIECRSNVFCQFYKKKTERSEPILRYSIFCGSLFPILRVQGFKYHDKKDKRLCKRHPAKPVQRAIWPGYLPIAE